MASNTRINASTLSNVYLNIPNDTTAIVETENICNLVLNADISNLFRDCTNLVMSMGTFKSNFSFRNVVDMHHAFFNCFNVTGYPVCGDNTENMWSAYTRSGVNGNPVCGNKVTNMQSTYSYCTNLIGFPVIGPNVTSSVSAYSNAAFQSAEDFTISAFSLQNLYATFFNTGNLGNANIYLGYNESGVVNASTSFYNKSPDIRLNLFVYSNGVWNTWLYTYGNSSLSSMLAGPGSPKTFTWTLDEPNSVYYNEANNIYVYYVDSYDDSVLVKSFNIARDWGLGSSYIPKLVHFEIV